MSEIIGRVLSPEEIERVREAGGPLAEVADLSKLSQASIPVVEVNGQIVAYWPVFYALHVEPLWIHPDHRGPGVAKALLEQMAATVERTGEPTSFAIIAPESLDTLDYASRLGFARVPGDLYYVIVPAPELVKG